MSPEDFQKKVFSTNKDIDAHYREVSKLTDEYATMPEDLFNEEMRVVMEKSIKNEMKKDDYAKFDAIIRKRADEIETMEQNVGKVAGKKV